MNLFESQIGNARQRGLSMVELLIAMALGVVLLLGLIQIFAGVRSSFNAADSRARIQESGRFALEFLRRDARMAGHLGCQSEYYHFPFPANRPLEPGLNGAVGSGFYNHLLPPGANSIRDNAPYSTQLHRPVEIYNYVGTSPGGATYVLTSDPAPDGSAGNWEPTLPDAGLGTISSRALPGSDIIVFRYLDESTVTLTGSVNTTSGSIPMSAADAAGIQRWGLYALSDCNIATMFQITGSSSATTLLAAAGGLNLQRTTTPPVWFDNSTGANYSSGSMLYRYQFVAYYVGQGVNGPALMRQTLIQNPTTANEGIALAPAEEIVEGVEMMQVLAGMSRLQAPANVREDLIDSYVSASDTVFTGAATPAALDTALRRVIGVRISLLIRGNASQAGAQRARDTIVVGDIRVTLPVDGRARQTYDTTIAIRNRLRA
jgi:type IV pilus assembly protein PilW